MPHKETKKHFTIGEVSEILGVNTSAIRFYDRELVIFPERIITKNRKFTLEDIELFRKLMDDRLTMKGKKELLRKKELVFKI